MVLHACVMVHKVLFVPRSISSFRKCLGMRLYNSTSLGYVTYVKLDFKVILHTEVGLFS